MFADWLDEHNEHDRAEFIRTQIELAVPELDADRAAALRRREKALLDLHGSVWQRPFSKEHAPKFTRGFVSHVTVSAHELVERGEAHLDAAPVTRVSLRDADEPQLIEDLSCCAFLSKLQALDLYGSPVGAEAARVLFGSPHLTRLRGLQLGEGDATPEMVEVLAERLTELRELYLWDFHQGELGDTGLSAIASNPAFAHLTTLNLLQTGVGADGARAVAESPHLRNLESLSFGFEACGYAPNYIGPEGVRHLARAPHLAGLRHLGLGLTRAGSAGARELAASPHLHRLRSLDLGLSELRDDGLAALAEWPGLGSVVWLNLGKNEIGPAGVAALANSPHTAQLETLGLSLARVGVESLRAIAAAPCLGRLRVLWLGYGLDESAMEILLGDNRFAQLADLHLAGLTDSQRVRLKARFGDRLAC